MHNRASEKNFYIYVVQHAETWEGNESKLITVSAQSNYTTCGNLTFTGNANKPML